MINFKELIDNNSYKDTILNNCVFCGEELLNKREEHLFPNCLYSCGICDVQYLYTPNYKFFAILIKNEKQILIDYFHTEHLNVRIFRMDIVRQFHICSEDFSRYRDDKLHNGVVRLVLP